MCPVLPHLSPCPPAWPPRLLAPQHPLLVRAFVLQPTPLVGSICVPAPPGPGCWDLFGVVTGGSPKGVLGVLGWATHPACPRLSSEEEHALCWRRQGSLAPASIPVWGAGRLSGRADVVPVTGFPLPFGVGAFPRSAVCPDTDSAVRTCLQRPSRVNSWRRGLTLPLGWSRDVQTCPNLPPVFHG